MSEAGEAFIGALISQEYWHMERIASGIYKVELWVVELVCVLANSSYRVGWGGIFLFMHVKQLRCHVWLRCFWVLESCVCLVSAVRWSVPVHFQSSVWVWSVAFGDALCSYQHLAASSANDVAVSAQNQKSQLEKAKHSAHGLDVLNDISQELHPFLT